MSACSHLPYLQHPHSEQHWLYLPHYNVNGHTTTGCCLWSKFWLFISFSFVHLWYLQEDLIKNKHHLKDQLDQTYAEVFNSIRDHLGRPYDPHYYSLHITDEGDAQIIPNKISPFTGHIYWAALCITLVNTVWQSYWVYGICMLYHI